MNGFLHILAVECIYKQANKELKDEFINGLNDDGMIVEIICKLTAISEKSSITNKLGLAWVRRHIGSSYFHGR